MRPRAGCPGTMGKLDLSGFDEALEVCCAPLVRFRIHCVRE